MQYRRYKLTLTESVGHTPAAGGTDVTGGMLKLPARQQNLRCTQGVPLRYYRISNRRFA